MDEINWFSMFLATITPMLVGLIYYHEAIFGRAWTDSISWTEKKVKKSNRIVALGISIMTSFLLSFFLLNFNNGGINQEGDFDTFQHGVWHGIFIAITVVTPIIVTNGSYGKQSWKKILINIFYWIITLALMGGILDAMNHWENVILPN